MLLNHTHARFKPAGLGSNGIFEFNILFKTEQRTTAIGEVAAASGNKLSS
jgi:hypothetical protein